MRRLRLIIQLLGLSALLLGSIFGSIILMSIVSYVLLMGMGSPGGNGSFAPLALLIFFAFLGLIIFVLEFYSSQGLQACKKKFETKNQPLN